MLLNDLPLFAAPAVPPLVRANDHPNAIAAAESIAPKLGGRHELVLTAFRAAGDIGLTDRELELQRTFVLWAPSTARKRRSELFQMGHLVKAGNRDGLTVWRLA